MKLEANSQMPEITRPCYTLHSATGSGSGWLEIGYSASAAKSNTSLWDSDVRANARIEYIKSQVGFS